MESRIKIALQAIFVSPTNWSCLSTFAGLSVFWKLKMASPQLENGFTQIANQIMEALIKGNLSGQAIRAILFVLRKTYGFKKKEDYISLTQFAKNLGTSKTRSSQIVSSLGLMKILTVTENINGKTKKYLFNKDFDLWEIPLRKTLTVNEKRKRPLRKTLTTKESITKENYLPSKNVADKRISSILKAYVLSIKEKKEFDYRINGGKDAVAVQRALKRLGSEEAVLSLARFYIDSQKYKDLQNPSLAIALSIDTENKYNQEWARAKEDYSHDIKDPPLDKEWWND